MIARTKPPPWLLLAVTAIPALLLFVQIVQSWVNVPYWDEWGLIAQLRISLQNGTLRPLDLFAQHNDSRFVLPQLLLLPLARLTHWDVRAEMFLIFATVGAISVLLWYLLGAIENLPRWALAACLLVCNCLLFSPIQYETWLWGINFSLVLPPFLLLVSLRINLSARSLPAKVGWNILLCFASTFSNANGMGNWLLAFPGFVRQKTRTGGRWLWYVVYFAAAAGTLILFFWNYQRHFDLAPLFDSPLLLLKYFFCWLGAPLALPLGTTAWIAGLCLSLIFLALSGAALLRPDSDRHRNAAYAFIALGCYAGMAGAAAALGRVGMEFEWALGSRYTTFSIYLLIAVVGLAALQFASGSAQETQPAMPRRQLVAALIVAGILASSLSTYHLGMKGMNWTRHQRALGRAALLFSKILPDNPDLKTLSPKPVAMVREYEALLQSGMARDALISPGSIPALKPRASADRRHGLLEVCEVRAGRLLLKGRAMREGKTPAPFVLFAYRTTGETAIPFAVAPTGESSPGLIRRGLRNCGFRLEREPDLPPGRIEISAWAMNPERNQFEQLSAVHLMEIAPVFAKPQ
ncbi:hypothetical protein BH18VER2_BH18VER2_08010 [soil metagenome]